MRLKFLTLVLFCIVLVPVQVLAQKQVQKQTQKQPKKQEKKQTPQQWLNVKGLKLIKALSNDSLKQRQDQTFDVVSDAFNKKELARLAMGKYWIELSEQQKEEYTQALIPYLVAKYTAISLPVEEVSFSIIDTIPSGKDILLKTTVRLNSPEEKKALGTKNELLKMSDINEEMPFFSLIFAVRPIENSYYIRDVQVEGKSLLLFLRQSVERIFEDSNYEGNAFNAKMNKEINDAKINAEALEKLKEIRMQKNKNSAQ